MSETKIATVLIFNRVKITLWTFLLLVALLTPGPVMAAVCLTAPTLSLDSAGKYSASGDSVDYLVTLTNMDVGSCDFVVTASGDDASFTSSITGSPLLAVGPGADASVTLQVSVAGATADWLTHVTPVTTDAIGSGSVNATTTVFDNNPLLHNSVNLNSAKHSGNWGSTKTNSKYGSITCATCHVKNTTNIKRIKTSITTPDNTNGSFPGDGQSISFQSAVDGSADMGDDTDGHAISNRICETCHSYDAAGTNGVKFHAYNMAADPGHYNQTDCIACHKHKSGFKASCSSCHGGGTVGTASANYWPDASTASAENDTPGLHLAHMNFLAQRFGETATSILDSGASVSQTDLCGYCHATPGADADHALTLPADTAFRPAWNKTLPASGSYSTADGNCTNICHNNKATGVGSYGWLDSVSSACIMCHNDINVTTAGTTGATHDRHLNLATDFGPTLVCASCHDGDTDWSGGTAPASNHIDGTLNLAGTKVAADEYSGTSIPGANFGSCSDGTNPNACHNDGSMSLAPARAYVWGSTLANDCASCHAALPTTNAHDVHVQTADASYGSGTAWPAGNNSTAGSYDFSCVNCHGTTKSNHLDGDVDVPVGGYVGSPGTCASAACHTDGTTPTVYKTSPAWNASFTAGACDGCHGNIPTSAAHPQHVLEVGFHYNAIYSGLTDFLPVVDSDAATTDQNLDDMAGVGDSTPGVVASTGTGYDQLRGHGGNLLSDSSETSTVVSCNVCHSQVVTVNTNDLGSYADDDPDTKACVECHDDAVTPKLGIIAVADKSLHVNGVRNVRFFDEKVRSKAQVRDERAYTVGAGAETNWTKATELTSNWSRFNGYKNIDGSSYDEQPDTLHTIAGTYWLAEDGNVAFTDAGNPQLDYYKTADKTCMISCHLWEPGRVDKYPVHWVDDSQANPTVSERLMCLDCHSRLPK